MQQMPLSLSLQGWPSLTQSSLQGLNPLFFFFMTLIHQNQSSLKTMDCQNIYGWLGILIGISLLMLYIMW